jgi:hypothetical protein
MSKDVPSFVKVGAGEPARSKAEIVETPPVFTEVAVALPNADAGARASRDLVEPLRQSRVSAAG